MNSVGDVNVCSISHHAWDMGNAQRSLNERVPPLSGMVKRHLAPHTNSIRGSRGEQAKAEAELEA